jgi:hypothetical protein
MPAALVLLRARHRLPGLQRYMTAEFRTLFARLQRIPDIFPAGRQIKHDKEMLRSAERKIDITASAKAEALQGAGPASGGWLHCRREPFETLHREQFVSVAVMAVGGIVGDSSSPRNLTESEPVGADFSDQGNRGIDEGLLQFAMMIRATWVH